MVDIGNSFIENKMGDNTRSYTKILFVKISLIPSEFVIVNERVKSEAKRALQTTHLHATLLGKHLANTRLYDNLIVCTAFGKKRVKSPAKMFECMKYAHSEKCHYIPLTKSYIVSV